MQASSEQKRLNVENVGSVGSVSISTLSILSTSVESVSISTRKFAQTTKNLRITIFKRSNEKMKNNEYYIHTLDIILSEEDIIELYEELSELLEIIFL